MSLNNLTVSSFINDSSVLSIRIINPTAKTRTLIINSIEYDINSNEWIRINTPSDFFTEFQNVNQELKNQIEQGLLIIEIHFNDGNYITCTDNEIFILNNKDVSFDSLTQLQTANTNISSTNTKLDTNNSSFTLNNSRLLEIISRLNLDSMSRLRISEPLTLGDCSFRFDKQDLIIDEKVVNGASSTHLPNESSILMTVPAILNARIVRQSKEYYVYQPGKSKFILMSAVMETSGGKSGIVSRVGQFDNHSDKSVDSGGNGHYFKLNNTTFSVVERSYVSGSQVETEITKGDFNIDNLDGNGLSGLTLNLDFSKTILFFIDYQWLGVGRVRMGLNHKGVNIVLHEWYHDQVLSSAYITTASLPIRYELENTTGVNTGNMKQICYSVQSEGGFNPRGKVFSGSRGITALATSTTFKPLISIRAKNAYNRLVINPLSFSITELTAGVGLEFGIFYNSTLTGASWVSANNSSGVEYDVTATAMTTSGIYAPTIESFSNEQSGNITRFENTIRLNSTIAGVQDILTIGIRSSTGSDNVIGSIIWQEWN